MMAVYANLRFISVMLVIVFIVRVRGFARNVIQDIVSVIRLIVVLGWLLGHIVL